MATTEVRELRAPLSPGRQNAIVAILAIAGMSASFMQTLLIPIQSELPRLLNSEAQATAWVITVTLLASAVAVPIAGKLGDMFGKRTMALWLLAILTVGSLVCAVAPGLSVMIIGRALQGMGMGVIPLGISLLGDVVDENKLGTSIALVSATLGVGGAIGLPISALVVENADWHILFVFAALVALISLVLVVLVVPRSAARTGGHVDFVGAGGLAVGLVGVLLAISQGNTWGWSSLPTLLSLAIGLVVLLAWGWFELRSKNPLVDLRISARPAVLTTNLASIAMGFALFASTVAFPQLLQASTSVGGMGLELLPASLVLVPSGLAMLAMSPVAGRVERNFGPKPLLIAGALVLVLAYVLCVFVPLQVWSVAVINAVIGVGIGLGYASMPALVMACVPANETGAANGMNTLMRSFGTTVASAVVGAILAASQHGDVTDSYSLVFLLGLLAAAVCAVIGFCIPQVRTNKEHLVTP